MLRVIFLLVCGLTFALQQNQNFRAGNITACFEQGFCNLTTGCCSGNGMCVYNTTSGKASCTCDSPKECRPGLKNVSSYSGPQCQTHPGDCCTNGTDDLSFSNNGGCHLQNSTILYPAVDNSTNLYPEAGARGSLLVRTGNATYGDGVGSIFSWSKSITTMVTNLTDPSRGIANTSGNMLGLGFLEFAIKDIVDYEYDYSNNVTFYNVTYPTLKCQNNTGITINTSFALNYKIPCQFANNASGVIDLGPLYDYAHRIPIPAATNSSQLGPYLDLTDAFAHWNATHHMPYEFMVALRYYAQYHYLAARNFEEFFCGQNSTVAAINLATCTIRNSTNANGVKYFGCDQDLRDWIFQQARRSTIRFSQAMLQMSVLSIALEYYDPQLHRSGYDGKFDTIFQMWWNGDGPLVDWAGTYNQNAPQPSVRQHQEWNNAAIQTRLAHTVQAGLNTLISLRNTDYNTSTADYLLNAPYNCDGYVTSSFAKEVVRLSRTPLHRYGSQIAKCFQADVAIELHRAGQLGLDYQTQVKGLTNAPNVTDLGTTPINFLFGTLTETNSTRQYYNTIASTALASIVEIHYVTAPNADRTGYYHYNSSYLADGNRFHPDPRFVTIPAYDFLNMWNCPVGASNCNQDISKNAAPFVLGYDPRMDPNENDDPFGPMEDDARWRSQGLTYNGPSLYFQPQNGANTPASGGFNYRLFPQWQLTADFLNVLFYQWDGLTTLAVKNAVAWGDSIYRYLPNPIVDSIPTNIGWLDVNFDGLCYDPYYMETSVGCRYNASLSLCTWNWQWQ